MYNLVNIMIFVLTCNNFSKNFLFLTFWLCDTALCMSLNALSSSWSDEVEEEVDDGHLFMPSFILLDDCCKFGKFVSSSSMEDDPNISEGSWIESPEPVSISDLLRRGDHF